MNVNIGPLSVQASHILLLIALLVAAGVGRWAGRRTQVRIGSVLVDMLMVGMLVGRIVFVATWFDQYRTEPLSMIDIRDGGFNQWAGIAAALAFAAWRAWQRPALREALSAGVLAGALVWLMSGAPGWLKLAEQRTLPAVPLSTLSGTPTGIDAVAKGRPAVVNLWATWCPPCRREMPILAVAQQRNPGIVFAFVNQGEDASKVTAYLATSAPGLANVLLDAASAMGPAVGSTALPTTLFYDGNGRLVDVHLGALSAASLESKLNQLRATAR